MVANFQNMTVKALRELAREHVGPGFSRLKTKGELVAALNRAFSKRNADSEATQAANAVEISAFEATSPVGSPMAVQAPEVEANGESKSPVVRSAAERDVDVSDEGEPLEAAADGGDDQRENAAGESPSSDGREETERELVQAFGKARAQCSDPFFLNEALEGVLPYDEALGELPESYDEESLVLITKGPYALYLYWDFSQETLARLQRMQGAVTCLRLFAGDQMVRELECTLNDRSWYFHGLQPGLTYRVELVAISAEGDVMRIGPSSNAVQLPTDAPSPLIDDRFIRLPFDVSASSVAEAIRQSEREEKATLPPLSRTLRALLYQASGGMSGRFVGASNWPREDRAEHPDEADNADDKTRSLGARRSSGPWSGTLLDAWGNRRPSSDTLAARQRNDSAEDDDEPPAH